MPISKTITSTPSEGMFKEQNETFNTVVIDATDDFRMITTTIVDNVGRTIEVNPVLTLTADAPELGEVVTTFIKGFTSGSYTETDSRDDVASNTGDSHTSTSGGTDRVFTKTVLTQEVEDNSYSKVTKQRLENGVVISEVSSYALTSSL